MIVNVIKRFRFREQAALAEPDGIDTFTSWTTNLTGLVRLVRAAGFPRVEAAEPFELPFKAGGDWPGLRGAVRAYV